MLQCEGYDVYSTFHAFRMVIVMVASPQIQLPQRRTLPNVCRDEPLEAPITRQVKPDKMGERRERQCLGNAAAEAIVAKAHGNHVSGSRSGSGSGSGCGCRSGRRRSSRAPVLPWPSRLYCDAQYTGIAPRGIHGTARGVHEPLALALALAVTVAVAVAVAFTII